MAHNKHAKPKASLVRRIIVSPVFRITAVLFLAVIIGILFTPFIKTTESKSTSLPFTTETTKDDTLELGEQRVTREGIAGESLKTYEVSRSIFNVLLGGHSSRLIASEMKPPTTKIVVDGTKKYQYMWCSNGAYRYYTDEQFQDPYTGFTSKSEDFCAQNGQGVKTQLADNAPGRQPTQRQSTATANSCTTTNLPYKTVYENVSYLDIGQTRESGGYDGFIFRCPNSQNPITSQPIDKIIYVGTREPSGNTGSSSTPQQTQNPAARQKCINNYNSAKSQLAVAGASNSSAMTQLNALHRQCLSAAGYL